MRCTTVPNQTSIDHVASCSDGKPVAQMHAWSGGSNDLGALGAIAVGREKVGRCVDLSIEVIDITRAAKTTATDEDGSIGE